MSMISGVSNFMGLDIGTTGIRLVQLSGRGPVKQLVKYASMPLDGKVSISDSKNDRQRLTASIQSLISQSQVTTKNVAVGIPSQKVFTSVQDMDRMDPKEFADSIRYQADSIIPTSIDESKIDWAILGDSPKDATKTEVLLSSVPNAFVEQWLDMLEGIGLNVIAFEPDNIALSRALLAPDATQPQMVIDIGSNSTDIVVIMNGAPRLTRSIATGMQMIVRSAQQNLNVDEKQAEQFVYKFGMAEDKLEGQVSTAIKSSIDNLMTDIEKSIKFFSTRYQGAQIERVIVTGAAVSIPDLPLYIANRFGLQVEIGSAWRNVSFPASMQDELLSRSAEFGVAAGLAGRVE